MSNFSELKKSFIVQTFPIECKGRGINKKEVLDKPVEVFMDVIQNSGNAKDISLSVKCKYNTGSHGQRCKASHHDVDKDGLYGDIFCPYSKDIPYVFD